MDLIGLVVLFILTVSHRSESKEVDDGTGSALFMSKRNAQIGPCEDQDIL